MPELYAVKSTCGTGTTKLVRRWQRSTPTMAESGPIAWTSRAWTRASLPHVAWPVHNSMETWCHQRRHNSLWIPKSKVNKNYSRLAGRFSRANTRLQLIHTSCKHVREKSNNQTERTEARHGLRKTQKHAETRPVTQASTRIKVSSHVNWDSPISITAGPTHSIGTRALRETSTHGGPFRRVGPERGN